MREAVVVSYARTGLAKSGRGGFNITPPMSMAAHAIKHAVERAGVDKDYVEDCYLGNCAHGSRNIGRESALLAGMPKTTAGVSVNRFCSSGLQTIAMAANSIRSDGADCIVAGGVESISVPALGNPKEALDAGSAQERTRHLHGDDRHRRHRRRALQAQPGIPGRVFAGVAAPHGRRPAGQQVQGRNRPDEDQNEGCRQGDQGREHRRLRRRSRRVQPSGHDHGRPCQARAGQGAGQVHHRRQRQPALRRRRRRGSDGSQGRREARPQPDGPLRRVGFGWLRARRDGHRSGVRRAEAA